MITFKLTREQWQYIATLGYAQNVFLATSSDAKQFIKEKFNADYDQSQGFGAIIFQTKADLIWFLLGITP